MKKSDAPALRANDAYVNLDVPGKGIIRAERWTMEAWINGTLSDELAADYDNATDIRRG